MKAIKHSPRNLLHNFPWPRSFEHTLRMFVKMRFEGWDRRRHQSEKILSTRKRNAQSASVRLQNGENLIAIASVHITDRKFSCYGRWLHTKFTLSKDKAAEGISFNRIRAYTLRKKLCLPKAKGAFPKTIRIDRQAVVRNKQSENRRQQSFAYFGYHKPE